MPTLKCPSCGTTVRFEGVAGLCPKCGKILKVASKPSANVSEATARAKPSAPAPRSRSSSQPPDLSNLNIDPDQNFIPAESPIGPAPRDPIILYLSVGAGGVILLFAIYFVLEAFLFHPQSNTPTPPPPVAIAPVPTPSVPTISAPLAPQPTAATGPTIPAITTRPAATGPAWLALKPVVPTLKSKSITDKMVETSIKKAVAFMKTQFSNGQLVQPNAGDYFSGQDALCVYSLLQAGLAVDDSELGASDPFMQGLLEHLKQFEMSKDLATYGRSLRASALSVFGRDVDRVQLEKDHQWLLVSELGGKYSYSMPPAGMTAANANWDNSNCQYGVLGIWATLQQGLTVPDKYWSDVEQHWISCQDKDGGWDYNGGGDSRLSMTCAGVTTLCFTAEQLELIASKGKKDARPQMSKAIADALAFLGKGNTLVNFVGQGMDGYVLYGVERAALATGYRWFGDHDWYRELGGIEIKGQQETGSWSGNAGEQIETAFRMLFLARGRQPLLMNKLRFDGDWNDRPRDVAKLTQFASTQLEKPFAWGVADLSRNWWDWLESPLLMISTDAAPNFSDEECGKLRSYTDAGGLIFLHNEFGSKEVDSFAAQFAKRVYPEFPMTKLATDSLVYNCDFPIKKRPDLQGVGNGTRMFMIYSPKDITQDWVRYRPKDTNQNPNLQMGINLFVTASGKSDFRNRLSSPYEPVPDFDAIGSLPVAQITYPGARAGSWNPEPKAYEQFSRWFQNQTSISLNVQPTPLTGLESGQAPVAVLTGNEAVDFSKMDFTALRNFVRKGGVLFIDSTGGSKAFTDSVHDSLLATAFPGIQPVAIPVTDPILAGTGACMDHLPKPHLRNYASMLTNGVPPGVQFAPFGQGAVIVSDLDVTTGLLNSGSYGINGYTPAYCQSLMKNVILWSLSRFSNSQ